MRKLGLVGGMGPESTVPYYKGIVCGVQQRLGRDEFPELTIESVDVFKVLSLCGQQKYAELTDYLLRALDNLAASGCDFAALSANTPHVVFDDLSRRSSLPLVSIVDAARDCALQRGIRTLGLLGTRFTMEGSFFREPFERAGIRIVTPDPAEREWIQSHIEGELERGIVREDTRAQFVRIIRRLQAEQGIEAIALGCTELPLLLSDETSPVPCLDTLRIHVDALVEQILRPRADRTIKDKPSS